MPGQHAFLSPSAAGRWIACPPSARLTRGMADTSNVYADEGTLAHSIGELKIRRELGWLTDRSYKTQLMTLRAHELYGEEEMDQHCEDYAAFVMEKFNEEPGSKIFLEKVYRMDPWIKEGYGTGDVVIIRPLSKRIMSIDLKYGKGVSVSAKNNVQGKTYLLGALNEFNWIYDIDMTEFIIYQPRLDSVSGDEYDISTLLAWGECVLKPAADLAWKGEGEFNPGDHCRFCKARPTCRALNEYNLLLSKYQFETGALLKDEEIADVLKKSKLFVNWIGAVVEYAQEEAIKRGKKWPGFKLVETSQDRRYTDQEAVTTRLISKGYDETKFIEPGKLLGITKMTKYMGKKDFETILKDLILKPNGIPTLVPEDDKRPAINTLEKAQSYFKDED